MVDQLVALLKVLPQRFNNRKISLHYDDPSEDLLVDHARLNKEITKLRPSLIFA